jgi:arylformamidase
MKPSLRQAGLCLLLVMLYDISPPISERLAVWPGDTAATREVLCDLAKGDAITLSSLRATVHLGAHADAPSHYGRGAPAIDQRPMDLYIGACRVVRVPVPRDGLITPLLLGGRISAAPTPRVLFATGTFPDPNHFNEDFAALSPELIDNLHSHGVRLVGIDTPSVDPYASKDLPAHNACLKHDLAILEGLVLEGVPEGVYELIALPLRLVGFDASPVRAVLRAIS